MRRLILAIALTLTAMPAAANNYQKISDQATFLSLVEGKLLRNRLYGVRLNVLNNGLIQGSAIGWDITGTWSWQDGYFCREMEWGGDAIPYNCQLVEWDGRSMRFTVDRGTGDSAAFRLQ